MCVPPFYLDVSVLARHSLVSIRIGNRGVGHLNRVYSGPDWSYSLSSFFRHMSAVQTLHATTVFSIQMFSGIDVLALQACTKRRRLCLDNVLFASVISNFVYLVNLLALQQIRRGNLLSHAFYKLALLDIVLLKCALVAHHQLFYTDNKFHLFVPRESLRVMSIRHRFLKSRTHFNVLIVHPHDPFTHLKTLNMV